MKKVLIITNLFHASPRIPGLAKYLREFGWEPVILTAPLGKNPEREFGGPDKSFLESGITIIETDYKPSFYLIKKILGFNISGEEREELKTGLKIPNEGVIYQFSKWIYDHVIEGILYYPDPEKSWQSYAVAAADKILNEKQIDAILSSSSPIICHIIAKEIKEQFHIPWAADLRDLWSQNHNYPYGKMRRFFDSRLEKRTLLKADAIVTVSPIWADQLSEIYGRPIVSITNGFDPETAKTSTIPVLKKFVITYTGQIYTHKQNPSKFLEALCSLLDEGVIPREDIEVRFFGPENGHLNFLIQKFGLSDVVKQYGVVPRQISQIKQKESQILLLFNWDSQKESGWHPLKIFEYLAAKRPILATGGYSDDTIARILSETHAGIHAASVSEIKAALHQMYFEYKAVGFVNYEASDEQIDKYSHRNMAEKFSKVLNDISS